MKQIICYLTFDGNCHQAMNFYATALGGKLDIRPFSAMPQCPQGSEDRVMHAHLTVGDAVLMASDSMAGRPPIVGTNISVSLMTETVEETERIFAALSDGANITMPLQNMFWNAYFGMLTDKFGIQWMLNCETTKA